MDAAERRRTFESLLQLRFDNSIVEIVAKTHVARFMNMSGLSDLETKCRLDSKGLFARASIPEDVFQDADTNTHLCDSIAFDFCLEQATAGSVAVLAKLAPSKRVEVRYEIVFRNDGPSNGGEGTPACISLTPRPLSCDEVKGYLFAYDQSGYPDVLNPHSVEFEIRAASE